jgi:N-acyl-D-aspartate/D-glutamate deacylase
LSHAAENGFVFEQWQREQRSRARLRSLRSLLRRMTRRPASRLGVLAYR